MTSEFGSKEQALETGLFYAGFKDREARDSKLKELLATKPRPVTLGWPQFKQLEVYEIRDVNNEAVDLGISQFRNGYDLWLINPENGAGLRV